MLFFHRFKMLSFLPPKEKKCIATVKDLANKLRDDTETEITFKEPSSSKSTPVGNGKRPRCNDSDDEMDESTRKKFIMMLGEDVVDAATQSAVPSKKG